MSIPGNFMNYFQDIVKAVSSNYMYVVSWVFNHLFYTEFPV